jgi:hypothetical protein
MFAGRFPLLFFQFVLYLVLYRLAYIARQTSAAFFI